MSKLEKYQTIIIFMAVLAGFLLAKFSFFENYAENIVIPALFIMLLGLFVNIPLNELTKSFSNFKFALTVAIFNFVWTPILVWCLGSVFLSSHPALWLGYIMLMVTPCIDWFLVFTGIAKGNVPLSASILPLNLVLQLVLLPFYLFIFAGVSDAINFEDLFKSILIILIAPFLLAQVVKYFINKQKNKGKYFTLFSDLQTPMLALAIAAMFASQGQKLIENINIIYLLLLPIILFYIITFFSSQLIGKKLGYSYEDKASLTITAIAKNSPMTLGIAVMAFPDMPIIALAMIIEPLIELPVMVVVSRTLLYMRCRSTKLS